MADFATLAIKVTTNGAKQASTDLGNLDKSAQKAEKSTQDLTNCLSRLARIVELSGVGLGIKQLLDLTDKMQSMANQVRFTTKTVEEFNVVQRQLFELAQNTRSSLESTTQLYVRASQAVKGYGYSQQQVLKFTETINKAMVVGGVGAQEQASALLQLSQALGSGKLQGDEFRSIAEAAPIILDTLATYLGKSREEVKKLATEGKLTSKIIFDAFSGSVRDIEEKFAEMPMSFGGAMQMLQNSAMKFFGELLNGSGITSAFANVIAMVANNLTTFAQVLGAIAAGHLVKLTASIFTNIQATIQKINADHAAVVAALSNAKATQAKIAAEIAYQQTVMASITAQMKMAQSEQTLAKLRMMASKQATLLNELHLKNVAATTALANAQTTATASTTVLGRGIQLLGGKIGLIGIAVAGAWAIYDNFIADATIGAEHLGVTWSDAFNGMWRDFRNLASESMSDFSAWWGEMTGGSAERWDSFGGIVVAGLVLMRDHFKNILNSIIGFFDAMFETISLTWSNFPVVMKNFGSIAVTYLINVVEFGVNKLIELVKAPFELLNDLSKKFGQGDLIDTSNWKIDLDKFKPEMEGEAKMLADAINNAFAKASKTDYLGNAYDYMVDSAVRYKQNQSEQGVNLSQSGIATLKNGNAGDRGNKKSSANSADDWLSYMSELERANTDGLTRIALEQERSMREMLEKAKKAGASHADIEKAKMLITERYAKERMEIAEKYVPSLKFERELKEQIKEIDQLQKLGLISTEQAGNAKEALAGKYNPVIEVQQQYINQLKEIEALKQNGVIVEPQAEVLSEKAKWEKGDKLAKIAGENEVSHYDKWKEQFDPMQKIKNEQATKLAELQTYYDQGLIQYQDFVNAKAQIDAQATADTQNLFMSSIQGFGSAMDTMMGVMRNAGQEQSGLYRTMFAMSKAFAIADSMLKLQQAIMQVMGDQSAFTPAQKFANMAAVASAGANVISTIQSVSLGGMAHSGIDNVPKEGTWLLDKGERVVDSRTNQDLKTFLANANTGGTSGGKSTVNVKIINNGQPVEAKVHSEETADGNLQLTVELMQTMDRIANERYRKNQMNDLRKGGALAR